MPKLQTTSAKNAENGALWAKCLHFGPNYAGNAGYLRDALGAETVTVRIPQVPQLLAVRLSHENIEGCGAAVVREC